MYICVYTLLVHLISDTLSIFTFTEVQLFALIVTLYIKLM